MESRFAAILVLLTIATITSTAQAYCVYNADNSDKTVTVVQLQRGAFFKQNYADLGAFKSTSGRFFGATLKPGEKACCNWQEKDCNTGGRDDSLIFSAIDQDVQPQMTGIGTREEVWQADMCYGIIPAGGALVVTARAGEMSCHERSKYGRELGFYQPLNALSWKMRRALTITQYARSRIDDIDWNNVFDGGKLADGSKQGVCRGYHPPQNYDWQQKAYKKAKGYRVLPKNAKSLLLGRLEDKLCIGELQGHEIKMTNFEYLTAENGKRVHWVKSNGSAPDRHKGMYAGVDWNSYLLSICRAPYNGGIHAGKHFFDTCLIGVDGKSVGVKPPFEVLMLK